MTMRIAEEDLVRKVLLRVRRVASFASRGRRSRFELLGLGAGKCGRDQSDRKETPTTVSWIASDVHS